MKTTRITVLIGLAALAISSASAADDAATKTDAAKLQGAWSMVSSSADGQEVPKEMLADSKRICKGDETTVTVGGQLIMKAKFSLEAAKQPKTIDYDVIGGPTKGKKHLGIYELNGDTVKFCFGAPGAERPTDFTSKPGERRTASVWKRDKN